MTDHTTLVTLDDEGPCFYCQRPTRRWSSDYQTHYCGRDDEGITAQLRKLAERSDVRPVMSVLAEAPTLTDTRCLWEVTGGSTPESPDPGVTQRWGLTNTDLDARDFDRRWQQCEDEALGYVAQLVRGDHAWVRLDWTYL